MTVVSSLRAVPTTFDPVVIRAIDARLDDIVRLHAVAIPLAIESGSRAWGFPSPDSDYDCRFVYVRATDCYLSPWPERDVIETPIDPVLDVGGWDLGKALALMVKGNATITEWLMSPIVYRGDDAFRAGLLELARSLGTRDRIIGHYLHLGERQRRTWLADARSVRLKKLFYALRPAVALRWLRLHPAQAFPPMNFPTLMAECDPPADISRLVADLLMRKAETRELGTAPLPAQIAVFLSEEFDLARTLPRNRPCHIDHTGRAAAADFFRSSLRRFG